MQTFHGQKQKAMYRRDKYFMCKYWYFCGLVYISVEKCIFLFFSSIYRCRYLQTRSKYMPGGFVMSQTRGYLLPWDLLQLWNWLQKTTCLRPCHQKSCEFSSTRLHLRINHRFLHKRTCWRWDWAGNAPNFSQILGPCTSPRLSATR